MRQPHIYTGEQIAWLRTYRSQLQRKELTKKFNDQFCTNLSISAVIGTCKRLKIGAGGTGRFEPGNKPHNSGAKGIRLSQATEFKPGHVPHNHVPVGTERMKSDYMAVKM